MNGIEPVNIITDVCICGGGPAGFIAAIASARAGARTLLIEKYGFLGGLATAGLVGPISKFNFEGERIVKGIPEEFIQRLNQANGAIIDLPSGNIPFDSELYKLTAQEMLVESGASILLHTTVFEVVSENSKKIDYLLAVSESNILRIEAEFFIDCSGTGNLIAGNEEWWQKRNNEHENQPLSLIFKLGSVDTSNIITLMKDDGVKYANSVLREHLANAVDEDVLSKFGGPWAVWGSVMREGQLSVNCTRYGGDVTDVIDFTESELLMRQEIMKIIEVFRKADPAFKRCYLQESAITAGYRESRELIGKYRLTKDDIFSGREFPDTIAYGAHPVDRHKPDDSLQKVNFLKKPYAIPLRSLQSKECMNLMAAGALLSAEPIAYASARVQAQCMAMGEAAGKHAARGIRMTQKRAQ